MSEHRFVTYKRWRLLEGQSERDLIDLIQNEIMVHYRKLDSQVQLGLLRIVDTDAYLATQSWPSRAYREATTTTSHFAQWYADYQPILERWDLLMVLEAEWECEELL